MRGSLTDARIQLTARNIIFNSVVAPRNSVVNLLCLVTKQFIYSQRCLGNAIIFAKLKTFFRQYENIEKYISIKNGNFAKHCAKWNCESITKETVNIQELIDEYVETL